MKKQTLFWVFGILQAITLGLIIFFILKGLNIVGWDTGLLLSIIFPITLLIIEYMIYSKK